MLFRDLSIHVRSAEISAQDVGNLKATLESTDTFKHVRRLNVGG